MVAPIVVEEERIVMLLARASSYMLPSTKSSSLDDIEFLARSDHRVTVLAAVARRPQSRSDLRELTGASASTIGRMLREFEKRRWIRRNGQQFEATQLGAFVATGMEELIDRLETEQQLRDVSQWLPIEDNDNGFSIEMASKAVVTVAGTDAPYAPVNRFVSLLRQTDRFQFVGYDVALLEPCKDEFRQRILDGMRTEIIDPPGVAKYILSTYKEHCAEPLESGNLTVRLHDDLPTYGISLFDDRIAISGYNSDNGTVQVLLDTDAAAARDWAESMYESYRHDARPLTLESTVG